MKTKSSARARGRIVIAVGALMALLSQPGDTQGAGAAWVVAQKWFESTFFDKITENDEGNAKATTLSSVMIARSNAEVQKLAAASTANALADVSIQVAEAQTLTDAHVGRIGYTTADLEAAQQLCYRGQTAQLADTAQAILEPPSGDPGADDRVATSTYPIQVARRLAQMAATERAPVGSDGYRDAIYGLPPELMTGDHYADGVALTTEQLNHLGALSTLVQPGEASSSSPMNQAQDGLRYGLGRQIIGHWFAGLLPLQTSLDGPGADFASRYPQKALPVARGTYNGQAIPTIPSYALLRAEVLAPWMDASPVNPQESYTSFLMAQNQTGVAREAIRLQVIENRVLYEILVWVRYNTLLAAEQDLRS